METEYTLRHPAAADIWPMLKILKKIGVKEFKNCFETEEIKQKVKEARESGNAINASDIGMEVALNAADLLTEKLPECEKEVYAFLSGLSGMKKEEIAAMNLSSFANMLIDVFRDEEFSDFFTAVSRLLR